MKKMRIFSFTYTFHERIKNIHGDLWPKAESFGEVEELC